MDLDSEVSDAILDLSLWADQQPDLAPRRREHVERLRGLRERIDAGDGFLAGLAEADDGDGEDEA